MSRFLLGALLCAASASACRGSRSQPTPQAPPPDDPGNASVPAGAELAAQSLAHGDLEQARELLDGLLLSDALEQARKALAEEAPEVALTRLDRALDLAPTNEEVRLLKADASLRLAEAGMASGGSAGLIEGALLDAMQYYGDVESLHALIGASRAAWLLGRREEALDLARRGMALRGPDEDSLGAMRVRPERVYAEQAYAAYVDARSRAVDDARPLFLESEDALARLLGRESDDAWAWSTLSDLYEWEGQLENSKDSCLRGLERKPEDAGLAERLARVSQNLEGPSASVDLLAAFLSDHPAAAPVRWQLAVGHFQQALDAYRGTPPVLDPAAFTDSEREFEALGAELPDYASGALGYRLVCRLARGWCALGSEDMERAQREFLAMNELAPRGVEWALPGELESGIQGLFQVADRFGGARDNLAAGGVFETLHALQPEQYLWANNAGFFLREAAVELEHTGRNLCAAARGKVSRPAVLEELRQQAALGDVEADSEAERAAFERVADEDFARARALMERSWLAYRPAAELAPEDIRVVNDAALILVYYLARDLDLAERLLLRCVELGGPQIEAKKAALAVEESPQRAQELESELDLLTEAWGDAHQNLGVLEWLHRKNAAAAEAWFQKSLEIWPDRPEVRNSLLPQVRGERPPQEAWAAPCGERP